MNIESQQSFVVTIKKFALMSAMILTLFPMMSQGKTMKMTADDQPILGRYEHVTIDELGDTQIKAKLDTGAYTASLNASDIEYFKKGDDDWVRFTPVIDDVRLATLELPLEKISKIKPRVEESEDQDDIVASKRPVVKMKVCLAGQWKTIDVNLTNRDHFNYPLLLGAKALRQYKALVDAGREYAADPACGE